MRPRFSAGQPGIVGILPALGSGFTDLARTGQHERLARYDLAAYARAFDEVRYWSYFDERLEDFTSDPVLAARVRLIPRRGPWPARAYALALPLLHRRHLRQCGALRVMQLTGVVPALIAHALYGTPFVVTYGYDYAGVARLAGARLKPMLLRVLERVALPRAAAVIVTSREMERALARHPARPRLAYFPNGVDTDEFRPSPDRVRGGAVRRVLYAGRLEPEKNVSGLVRALACLRDVPARLVAIGDGRLRGALAREAEALGVDAEWKGVVPHREMPHHLAEADCLVLPSFTEGHPKVLVEAMAAGVPCAASARGGIPSMLEHEVTGLLFDPDDPGDIARAVRRLLTDEALARRLGERARAAAVAEYDARVVLAREARFVRAIGGGESRRMAEDYAAAVSMDAPVPDFVAARLRPLAAAPPARVLDVGAGDGRYVSLFRDLFPAGTSVTACELSLVRARRLRARGVPVIVADAEALPFRPGAFELITLMEVIEHTRSPERALAEAERALAPAGRLVLTTPNYPMKRLFDLRAALRQRSLARLRDDPTHISPLTAGRLARLLAARFRVVELEGTAVPGEGWWPRLRRLRRSRLGLRLANKLYAVCAPRAAPAGGDGAGRG